jgi:uncharacterized membrane protein YdjX (TVP38/TMEM64 family)
MFAGAIGIKIFDIVLFGGIGLIIGAVIAFYIAKIGGKPIVAKLIGEKWINRVDKWVEKNGVKAILLSRLIPIIPFDLISYISGVTSLDFKYYLLATIIGSFPRAFILAAMGVSAKTILNVIGIGLELTIVLGVIGFIILTYLDRKGYLSSFANKIIEKVIKK